MLIFALSLLFLTAADPVLANEGLDTQPPGQGRRGGPPPTRQHTATQSEEIHFLNANQAPIAYSRIDIQVQGDQRIIRANGIAEHDTGLFPNQGNPNSIAEQSHRYVLSALPQRASRVTHRDLGVFGIGINGILFDPSAAEWYQGNRNSGWQYDPLGGAVVLGLDDHTAHVQRDGTYHYHGLPTGLLEEMDVSDEAHSPVIGWAMDGFPIYSQYGYDAAGNVIEMRSSYVLKYGDRPSSSSQPGGGYDGTFVADYEYLDGMGNLDECNAAFVITPEMPEGGWAYFLTSEFPVVPRCFIGTPLPMERPEHGRRRPRRN